jgi:Flp pilus assembly protein TadD
MTGTEPSNNQTMTIQQAIERGLEHHQAGRLAEAEDVYNKILKTHPDHPFALHMLGVLACQRGELDLAVDLISKAVAIMPDYLEAHSNLGNAFMDLGKLDKAVFSYNKAIAIKPDYAKGHFNLANALKEQGKLRDAVSSYQNALASMPDFADAHSNLGNTLKELGELDEAINCYHKALAIKPDLAEAHSNLADLLDRANRTEELRAAVSEAQINCPDHPRLSISQALLFKRDGDHEAARDVLIAAGDQVRDPSFLASRAHLLGELCDKLGDTDAAFEYFSEGNHHYSHTPKAKRADAQRYLAKVGILTKRFTSDWVAKWKPFESNDERSDPAFLVGFPRSGTTLLDTILMGHNAITVIEEKNTVDILRDCVERMHGGYPDALANFDTPQLTELRRIYFAELDKIVPSDFRAGVVIDKMPLNLIEVGLIHRVFPKAKFLFAQRDPRDCVLSCFMQHFVINDAMANFLNLKAATRLYDKAMTLWQLYQAIMTLDVHTVRYESLIEDFEGTVSPALDFLGLDWDDGVRNYAETALQRGRISTASYNQVTQDLYTSAQGRWEGYQGHLQPVLPVLNKWAKRMGYES